MVSQGNMEGRKEGRKGGREKEGRPLIAFVAFGGVQWFLVAFACFGTFFVVLFSFLVPFGGFLPCDFSPSFIDLKWLVPKPQLCCRGETLKRLLLTPLLLLLLLPHKIIKKYSPPKMYHQNKKDLVNWASVGFEDQAPALEAEFTNNKDMDCWWIRPSLPGWFYIFIWMILFVNILHDILVPEWWTSASRRSVSSCNWFSERSTGSCVAPTMLPLLCRCLAISRGSIEWTLKWYGLIRVKYVCHQFNPDGNASVNTKNLSRDVFRRIPWLLHPACCLQPEDGKNVQKEKTGGKKDSHTWKDAGNTTKLFIIRRRIPRRMMPRKNQRKTNNTKCIVILLIILILYIIIVSLKTQILFVLMLYTV